jgi:transcription elongation factor Elf1
MTIKLGFKVKCPRCDHKDAMKLVRAEGMGTYRLECKYCGQMIHGNTRHIVDFRSQIKNRFPRLVEG